MAVTIARLVLAIGMLLIAPVMAAAQSAADFYKGKNVDPVSYTHLTLPTNREV